MAGNSGSSNTGSVVIQIVDDKLDEWSTEFENWSKCVIPKVPRKLRKVNESAYTPQLISIGPFHHGKEDLKDMENHKHRYASDLFERIGTTKEEVKANLESTIKTCYEKLQRSYEGNVKLTYEDREFEKMILIDACFIIELFLRNVKGEEGKKDYILGTPWRKKAIKLDLILLENQIPFFVLEKIFGIVKSSIPCIKFGNQKVGTSSSTTSSINVCICGANFLTCCQLKKSSQQEAWPKKPDVEYNIDSFLNLSRFFFKDHVLNKSDPAKFNDSIEIKNFTDLVRQFWLPRNVKTDVKQGNIRGQKYLYCATKLDKAGVTFAPARKQRSLADVELFEKPFLKFVPAIRGMQLKLPVLKLENDTECLLRNVMALEQCLYPEEAYICSYVRLMDQLINTREDVDFLVEKKILTNLLGSSKEAAKLFNGLCDQIPQEKAHYAHYYKKLNEFYENRWNVTRAALKKVYFKDLWTGSSTVVGICVLIFTVSATIKNVYFRHL